LDGNFAMWVGELIQEIKQEIVIVSEQGREEEAMIRLSRVGYDYTVGFLNGGFEAWKTAEKEIDSVHRIGVNQLKKEMELGTPVFDVRKKSEFESEHVIGAINTPLNQLNDYLSVFPKDKHFILHCAGGYRSMIAASILKSRGFEQFEDVVGGMAEIAKSSIPTTDYVCPTTLL
jgi:rhodanese-related sulfurtransferase